jgi:intracellular septation protein A
MKPEPSKKHVMTPTERKRRSRRLNLILMIMAVVWGLLMFNMDEHIFIRWFAAVVLFVVGLTGYLGIGTERTRKPKQ